MGSSLYFLINMSDFTLPINDVGNPLGVAAASAPASVRRRPHTAGARAHRARTRHPAHRQQPSLAPLQRPARQVSG